VIEDVPSSLSPDSDDEAFVVYDTRKKSLKNLRKGVSSNNLRKSLIDEVVSNPRGELQATRDAAIAGTTLSSATTVSMSLQNKGCDIHANGYFVAAKKMCKLVTPSSKSITIAGGKNITNYGEIQIRAQRPGKGTKTKTRHCVLKNGTMKFYALNVSPEPLDECPPDDLLHGTETVYVQHIRNIRMNGPKSKSFILTYWNKPKRTWMERQGDQVMKMTLRRKNKKKKKGSMTDEYQRASANKSRKYLRSANESQMVLASRSSSTHSLTGLLKSNQASLPRRISRSLSFRNRAVSGEDDLAGVEVDEDEVEEERDVPDYVTEKIMISAPSPEEACRWVRFILMSIENQAVVFAAFAEILRRDPTHAEGAEALRRHGVDLLTLAKGHSHPKVLEARKKLADTLEDNGRFDESAMWYDLSEEDYTETDKAGFNVNDSFFQLVEFFKDNHVINADEEARKLFERGTPSEICVKLHKKFNRVPTGWGYYLRQLAKQKMLVKFQEEIEDLKSRDYFYSTRFGTILE